MLRSGRAGFTTTTTLLMRPAGGRRGRIRKETETEGTGRRRDGRRRCERRLSLGGRRGEGGRRRARCSARSLPPTRGRKGGRRPLWRWLALWLWRARTPDGRGAPARRRSSFLVALLLRLQLLERGRSRPDDDDVCVAKKGGSKLRWNRRRRTRSLQQHFFHLQWSFDVRPRRRVED